MKPLKKIHLDTSLYKIPGWVYFLTIVANFKSPFFVDENFNREIIECIRDEKETMGCKIYVYCLMPDHLHLLCGTSNQEKSVLDFVNRFKGKSTRIGWKYGIKGGLWQRRSYDHILRKKEDLGGIADYIINNPVRRGIVKDSREYPYSGVLDQFDS